MDQVVARDPSATRAIRRAMVDNQIRTFDVTDQPLLDRFYTVPRELFLPDHLTSLAYSDAILTVGEPAGARRVLLMPMVLARLLQGASVRATDRVLTVAGGAGYAAALLAGLAAEVVALESDAALSESARKACATLRLDNVSTVTGTLPDGHGAKAPYDMILVEGAVEGHLERLLAQLAPRGRLLTIQKMLFDGVRRSGKAMMFERFGDDLGSRALFDSSAVVMSEFAVESSFAF